MAESWIRVRGSLVNNPKVIKMARLLLQDADFLSWYSHDGVTLDPSRSVTTRHVTVVARVTVGALTPLWAQINDAACEDGFVPGIDLFEIDMMSGVPGLGRAMQAVRWVEVVNGEGVVFVNFSEHNTVEKGRSTEAMSGAQRSKAYRERKKLEGLQAGECNDSHHEIVTQGDVTNRDGKSDASRNAVTTEKSREEKSSSLRSEQSSPAASAPAKPARAKKGYTAEFEEAWAAYPSRPGASKSEAFKAWNARLAANEQVDVMLDGIRRYAAYCQAERTESRFIKHAATFLGSDLHYRSNWTASSRTPAASRETPYQRQARERAAAFAPGIAKHAPAAGMTPFTIDMEDPNVPALESR